MRYYLRGQVLLASFGNVTIMRKSVANLLKLYQERNFPHAYK